MGQHHGQKGVAEEFVDFFQPVAAQPAAPFLVGGDAADRERQHQRQQGGNRQGHQQVLTLAPIDWRPAGPCGRQRSQPCWCTGQFAPQQPQPGLTRPEQAVERPKHQQPGQGVAQGDVQQTPAFAVGGQVGTQKAQGKQPVKNAGGRVDDATPGSGRTGRRRSGGGKCGVRVHAVFSVNQCFQAPRWRVSSPGGKRRLSSS